MLRIYRTVPEKPKQKPPMNTIEEQPTVRPGDLATEFKERTNKQLSEKLPEDMAFFVARLRSLSDTR